MDCKKTAPRPLRTIRDANTSSLSTDLHSTPDGNSLQGQGSPLLLRAFILDTQLEHPDQVVIAVNERDVLLSEVFAFDPSIRQKMVEERAEVFRQLGWEVPENNLGVA